MFENFARELLHEAEHGETPQYVRVSRAMPDLAHQLRQQHENQMNTMSTHHQAILTENKQEHVAANSSNRQEHMLTRDIILQNCEVVPFIVETICIPYGNYGAIYICPDHLTLPTVDGFTAN
jgi:histidinol dehydrogenase